MAQSTILPRSMPRERTIANFSRFLAGLPMDRAWRVEVCEHKPTRTQAQNSLLWAIYGEILKKGGETLGGWTKDDLHDFFLINHFGGDTRTLFGRKRIKPKRRSSKLNKQEFSNLVESILRFMAEQGVYIEMPSDMP